MIRQTIALTERKQTQSKQSNKQKLWWKTSIVSRCLTATNLLLQRSIGCCGSIIKCLSFDGSSIVWQYHERSMIIVKGWLKFEAIIAILQQPDRKVFVRNRSRFIQTNCAIWSNFHLSFWGESFRWARKLIEVAPAGFWLEKQPIAPSRCQPSESLSIFWSVWARNKSNSREKFVITVNGCLGFPKVIRLELYFQFTQ